MNQKQIALIKTALNMYIFAGICSDEEFQTLLTIHDYFDLEQEKESHLDENLIKE